jgi:hypothetical protein
MEYSLAARVLASLNPRNSNLLTWNVIGVSFDSIGSLVVGS